MGEYATRKPPRPTGVGLPSVRRRSPLTRFSGDRYMRSNISGVMVMLPSVRVGRRSAPLAWLFEDMTPKSLLLLLALLSGSILSCLELFVNGEEFDQFGSFSSVRTGNRRCTLVGTTVISSTTAAVDPPRTMTDMAPGAKDSRTAGAVASTGINARNNQVKRGRQRLCPADRHRHREQQTRSSSGVNGGRKALRQGHCGRRHWTEKPWL